MTVLFCDKCGYIEEPGVAAANCCPICESNFKLASGDTAVVLHIIKLRSPEFKAVK